MGLSSLPAPSEGVLCVLLVNTALSLSIFKAFVRTILHIVGISLSSPTPQPTQNQQQNPSPAQQVQNPNNPQSTIHQNPSYSCVEEFRNRVPTMTFREAARGSHGDKNNNNNSNNNNNNVVEECSVCLNEFEDESEINHLACGHVFHRVCLEKWLDYNCWNITCPLCRTPLMSPEEDLSCFW